MSSAGFLVAELALPGDDAPRSTPAGDRVSIVAGSLEGGREQQSRTLAQVTATPSPTASPTLEPTATLEPAPTATEPPPPATATPEPPTPTPEPPTPTPEPPTPTPLPPTPTPEPPTPTPEPPSVPSTESELLLGTITSYADSLAGLPLGCSGYGAYDPNDPTVIAVGPDHYEEWPCGTELSLVSTPRLG
jgi:hypothetical protein